MFLAIKEMRRTKVRFGLLIAAIALLVFLILFQQSLQNGLLTSFVGAIRNQTAPVLVYSVDGQRFVQSSIITPDLEELVRSADGVGDVGRIGQGTFTVRTSEGVFDASVLGYEATADGFAVGDTVTVAPGGYSITVVGLARDAQLSAAPTIFVTYDTYVTAVVSVNPDAGEPLPNVLAIQPADGVTDAEVVDAVNAQSLDLDALARADAAGGTPGVAQVRQSFQVIFLLYGLVIPCVTGLFFLIVTFQKSGSLTLLRAIGAPAGRLVTSLLIQAVLIVGLGFALGTALYAPVSQLRLGGIPLRFETAAVIGWAIGLLVLGVGSSLLSARRVLAIDPVEATTGGGR